MTTEVKTNLISGTGTGPTHQQHEWSGKCAYSIPAKYNDLARVLCDRPGQATKAQHENVEVLNNKLMPRLE